MLRDVGWFPAQPGVVAAALAVAICTLASSPAAAQVKVPIEITHAPPEAIKATEIVITASSGSVPPIQIKLEPKADGTTSAVVDLPRGEWRINVRLNTRLTYRTSEGRAPVRATYTTPQPIAGSAPLAVFLGPERFGACQGGPHVQAVWLDDIDKEIAALTQELQTDYVPLSSLATKFERMPVGDSERAKRAEEEAERLELQAAAIESGFASADSKPADAARLREDARRLLELARGYREAAGREEAARKRLEALRRLRQRVAGTPASCPTEGARTTAPAGPGEYVRTGPLAPGEFYIPGTNSVLKVGGGVRAIDDVNTSNGGLGGSDTVPALEFSGEARIDRERMRQLFGTTPFSGMSFRLFGSLGGGENGLNGAGSIMLQPNGGIQDVSGAGAVSGGEFEVDVSRFGFEMRFYGPEQPLAPGVMTPFLGFGFQHRRLDTELAAQWAPINFVVVDSREVRTNRLSAQGGLAFNVPLSPDMYLVLQGLLQLNADMARARGRYFTEQTGVFSETVTGRASDTSITVSGELSATGVRTFPNGAQVELRGWVGFDRLQQAEYHQGMPMTIDNRGVVDYGFDLRLVIPISD